MSRSRKARNEKADGRGGSYSRLPHCLLKHDAYRTASFRARAALDVLARRHNGFNNGRITMSADELAHGLNCQNHRANSAAMGELIARGIVSLERDYPRGSRLAREYRLTYVSTLQGANLVPATNEYLAWTIGSAGTVEKRKQPGKSRVAMMTTEEALSSVVITTERKKSSPKSDPIFEVSQREPIESVDPSVAVTTTHIGGHATGSFPGPGRDRFKRPELERPDSVTADAWRAAAARAAENSAAPSADEMRDRTIVFLANAPRGTQTLLAKESGIPDGTLSRFINQEGPLSPRACVDLTCALGRLQSRPQKGHAA